MDEVKNTNSSEDKSFNDERNRFTGMPGFTVVWFGQLVSLLGTTMTGFALTIWAWQITGKVTALALVAFFSFGPTVILSPIAGALVDRWNRKTIMIMTDLIAGIMTIIVLTLYITGKLQIWHLFITGAITGAFQAFQFPAYSAAITMMLPKKHYTRASGMLSLADSASVIAAPILAGILLKFIGIAGVMTIDILTFIFAIGALLMVYIPQPPKTEAGQKGKGSIWRESLYGFEYILQRPSLLGLQLVFFASNFMATIAYTVLAPMILARTGNNSVILGSVWSTSGVGGVLGALLLSIWGGPKQRVHGVLLGMVGSSLLGMVLMGAGHNLPIWMIASFFASFFLPIINGSNQGIWQAKVAPDVQGRVFAVRRLIAQITAPVAMLIAGPLADYVFEPAMSNNSTLALSFGWLVGTDKGSGMSLMFIIFGLLGALVGLGSYTFKAIREAEDLLPDHDVGGSRDD